MKSIAIAYVPVLHEGYRNFFEKNKKVETFYILGESITSQFRPLVKDIRALKPELMRELILSMGFLKKVEILEEILLKEISKTKIKVVAPDEDVSREILLKHFSKKDISFKNIFLRWDSENSLTKILIEPDRKITSKKKADQELLKKAIKIGEKSSDIWRQVGAVIVKDGEILLSAHNKHVPSEHTPYVNGDPRGNFHKGLNLEISTAFHGEAKVIAEAAKKGISLEGASIYVTDFPCPPCAKLIAYSGIKKLYYGKGYGVLDGESILKANGVEIIFVDLGK